LGLGVARDLARRGDRVILTARSQDKADGAAETLRGEGLEVVPRALDVASDESVAAFFRWLDDEHGGRVDVLVNNAGMMQEKGGPAGSQASSGVVLEHLDNNALSAYRMLEGALPRMNRHGYGRVVNVSSGMGGLTEMGGGHPAYRLSKAAMNALTRIFHDAASGDVKVNSVCPGWVKTDMGGPSAHRELAQGVASITWAANLGADGPSGGFFRDGKALAW
ncbi:MAG: SDR family NAD(P)-dependent oxidoreductase, partial [Myxococcales bacterium]|nr:SDR family NAD(P)-dependent oxidoreductase [Myxococcales bacterium]